MTQPRPYFEVFMSRKVPLRRQRWYWRLVAGNGEVVAMSEPYVSEASARRGADDARSAASQAVDIRQV